VISEIGFKQIRPPLQKTCDVHADPFSEVTPIQYPKPDGVLSFDILTSVARTGTNHAEGQPSHLQLPREEGAKKRHTEKNVVEYGGLLGNACPAAVYEYQDAEGGDGDAAGKKFVINSQNCIHVRAIYPGSVV
jgi:electron-transferring-flavoprotein dehydrogenase